MTPGPSASRVTAANAGIAAIVVTSLVAAVDLGRGVVVLGGSVVPAAAPVAGTRLASPAVNV